MDLKNKKIQDNLDKWVKTSTGNIQKFELRKNFR